MASRRAANAIELPRGVGETVRGVVARQRAAGALDAAPDLGLGWAFAGAIARYGALVFAMVGRELDGWRARARAIPDETLRQLALQALAKRGNMEGAALFAAFAPPTLRGPTVRALVAYQAAYNYLDLLAEQPRPLAAAARRYDEAVADGRQLHAALLVALQPQASHGDYYALHPRHRDGGYLAAMVDSCRASIAALPSFSLVASSAQRLAARIVDFQGLNVGEREGGAEGLRGWALGQAPAGAGLTWWEVAAAAGSSLGVHALIGLAAEPGADGHAAAAIEAGYFPWIGALHSLLDSAVDVAEDRREHQRNLLGYYSSPAQAAQRTSLLARHARVQARAIGDGHRHEVIVAAMVGYHPSAREVSAPGTRMLAARVSREAGPLAGAARTMLRAARPLDRLVRG